MDLAINSYDASADHIQATVTNATGDYAGTVGIVYITYSISGSTGFFSGSPVDYPAVAAGGPYIKQ